MIPKPKHLSAEYAAIFKGLGTVDAYHNRPPYPAGLFDLLVSLLPTGAPVVLDVGCGTGDLARGLVGRVGRVDAVDFSAEMIRKGMGLPDGNHPALRWIYGPAEEVELNPPYGLVSAGDSLHWLAWDVALPRFAAVLAPGGFLAIVTRNWGMRTEAERDIFRRHSVNRDFQPYDLVEELTERGLFQVVDRRAWRNVSWTPTIDEYVESRHSQNAFPRELMGEANARAFDRELRDLIESLRRQGEMEADGDRLRLTMDAEVIWGEPLA